MTKFQTLAAVPIAALALGATATLAIAAADGTRSEARATVTPPQTKQPPQKKVTLAQAKRACATLRAAAKPNSKTRLTPAARKLLNRRCAVARAHAKKTELAQAKKACATLQAAARPKSKIRLTPAARKLLNKRCAVAKAHAKRLAKASVQRTAEASATRR